ncbi:MAG TPA: nitroreductase family deazaflavin-dependent oxidoreductase [Acidimicrobiia bacterium]|jgi:deazaflavin-dependent oxidoreductase (nitroreductase family)
MTLEGEYEPSPWDWVSKQVEEFEASGGKEGNELQGKPIVVLSTTGRKTAKVRKSALMRVEHDGEYAVVASMGGAPQHPVWYLNLLDDPHVTLQDGDKVMDLRARTATPDEKKVWWPICVEAWPAYDEYQTKTTRDIPVVLFDKA